tara:strand:+ start:603 stop:854 length:252 start_codon:yes stop_codon:yes gene_type:complete
MTLYSNFFSSAINSVETKNNQVFVTFSSNIDKNYEYNCENVAEFTNNLCSVLISNELDQDGGSVGQFISQARKSGVLVDSPTS